MLQHGKRPTIASRHGMVAAAHPLAAAAGGRILGNGGNAFDAAAATAATLNVVEPDMSGLAGMGMATCYIASERRVRSLNFMSLIPRKFPLEKLSRREQIVRGPIPVGAPGCPCIMPPRIASRSPMVPPPRDSNSECTLRRSRDQA